MSKYNRKKEEVKPTVKNFMNEDAFLLKPKEEFISSIMTTFLSKDGSYYESSDEIEFIYKAKEVHDGTSKTI